MKKRVVSLLLTTALTASLIMGCGGGASQESAGAQNADTQSSADTADGGAADSADTADAAGEAVDLSDFKVGAIYIGDENEGYTAAHMKGIREMKEALGLSDDQVLEKTNIPEDESCLDAAIDLAEQGCKLIFATSFGHETYILQAAEEYPDVQFCHATGFRAAESGLSNMHNYFASIYEARYVSGVVAGLKLNEMIENDPAVSEETAKIGYVGAFPFAEVISGYTSFFLGARSVCPSATMEVRYTNSWADPSGEAETATQLIANGCVLISQHADTTGAPGACEQVGVPCVGYNISMISVAPHSALTSPCVNWGTYCTYAANQVVNGQPIDTDWCQGFSEGAVQVLELNEATVAEGSAEAVEETTEAIKSGALKVFDTSTFTVDGKSLEDRIAEGGDYADYEKFVYDGCFHEQELQSSPAFDIIIDGITSIAE